MKAIDPEDTPYKSKYKARLLLVCSDWNHTIEISFHFDVGDWVASLNDETIEIKIRNDCWTSMKLNQPQPPKYCWSCNVEAWLENRVLTIEYNFREVRMKLWEESCIYWESTILRRLVSIHHASFIIHHSSTSIDWNMLTETLWWRIGRIGRCRKTFVQRDHALKSIQGTSNHLHLIGWFNSFHINTNTNINININGNMKCSVELNF